MSFDDIMPSEEEDPFDEKDNMIANAKFDQTFDRESEDEPENQDLLSEHERKSEIFGSNESFNVNQDDGLEELLSDDIPELRLLDQHELKIKNEECDEEHEISDIRNVSNMSNANFDLKYKSEKDDILTNANGKSIIFDNDDSQNDNTNGNDNNSTYLFTREQFINRVQLSEILLLEKVKLGGFEASSIRNAHNVEYSELDVFSEKNGKFKVETIENAMTKSMMNLAVEAHFIKKGSSISVNEQATKWGDTTVGDFIDPNDISKRRSMSIAEYLEIDTNVTINSQPNHTLIKMYETMLSLVDSNKISTVKTDALLEVKDGNWKGIFFENKNNAKFAEGYQELMYKIMGRNVGNLMLDMGASSGTRYNVVSEWMRHDPEYSNRMIVVGDDLERGTDKFVYIKSSKSGGGISGLANIEYKSWDTKYPLLFGGNDVSKNPIMGNMGAERISMAGLPGTKNDYKLNIKTLEGKIIPIPDWVYVNLDDVTKHKIAALNKEIGRFTTDGNFYKDPSMDGLNIFFPQVKGIGIGYLDRLSRDWSKFGVGYNSIEINSETGMKKFGTNIDESAVVRINGLGAEVPHYNLLNGLSMLKGDWMAIMDPISSSITEVNPKFIQVNSNGETVLDNYGDPIHTNAGRKIYADAMTVINARKQNIQKAQINELSRRGTSFRFSNPRQLGSDFFNMEKQGSEEAILKAVIAGIIIPETMFKLDPNGNVMMDGDTPVINDKSYILFDIVLPNSGGKNINVKLSGASFWTERTSNLYGNDGKLLGKMDGFMGLTIDDLTDPLPKNWTNDDVSNLLKAYSFDIWKSADLAQLMGLSKHLDQSDQIWLNLIRQYKILESDVSGHTDNGEAVARIQSFRSANSRLLWDSIPIEVQNRFRGTLDKIFTKTPDRGLLSSFSSSFSEGGNVTQELIQDLLVITGKAIAEGSRVEAATMKQLHDPRLTSNYDHVTDDLDNIRISSMTTGFGNKTNGGYTNSLQAKNGKIITEWSQTKIKEMRNSPINSIFSPKTAILRPKLWSKGHIVTQCKLDIINAAPSGLTPIDQRARKSLDAQELFISSLKTNIEFSMIGVNNYGQNNNSICLSVYEPINLGITYEMNKRMEFNNLPDAKQQFLNSLKPYFYIEEGPGASSNGRFLEKDYQAVQQSNPLIWDDFITGKPLQDNVKIRMALEFRNNSPGATNYESLIFGESGLKNGLNIDKISQHSWGYLYNGGAGLYAIATRTRILEENKRPFSSITDELFLENKRRWRDTVAYTIKDSPFARWVQVTFGDIEGMIKNGDLKSNIRLDIPGYTERDKGLLDFLAWNHYFTDSILRKVDRVDIDGNLRSVWMMKSTPNSIDSKVFSFTSPRSASPFMYVDNNTINDIQAELKNIIKWEGKPSTWLKASKASKR